jgi:hypothetical protein
MREKSPGSKIRVVAKHADLPSLDKRCLTNDVYAIRYDDDGREWVDLVRGRMVDVFDAYYDSGFLIKRIWHAGGYRNPKLQECELRVKAD